MTEEQHRKWDTIIKGIVTPFVAVVTVSFGIFQYTDGQRAALEKEYALRKLERSEKLFEEKKSLYKETRSVVSFLSSADSISELKSTKKSRFWELYWGDLAAVESSSVEGLMVRFGSLLKEREREASTARREELRDEMQQISLAIANQTELEISLPDSIH